MQLPIPRQNLKMQEALSAPQSQVSDFLGLFIRGDEFFWRFEDSTGLTPLTRVSVSGEDASIEGQRSLATDRLCDIHHEWRSRDSRVAWIHLDWDEPMYVGQVTWSDRLDHSDNVLAGTMTFSDGSQLPVTFAPGRYAGFASPSIGSTATRPGGLRSRCTERLQAARRTCARTSSVAPRRDRPPSTPRTQSSLSLDGDPLQYRWTTRGGTAVGQGPSARYTPPADLKRQAVVTMSGEVSDGRGGAARNSAFVTVRPAAEESGR